MKSTRLQAALSAFALAALTVAGCSTQPVQGRAASRPNILLIVADDLGYSDLGAYGGEIPTPNIDALAAQGRLLTNFHVAATCSPTRSMLLSGVDHHRAGLGGMAETTGNAIRQGRPIDAPWGERYSFNNIPAGYEGFLSSGVASMPELLRDAGYHTYMVGKWHLAWEVSAPAGERQPPLRIKTEALPSARGFEKSFALVNAGGSHFAPTVPPSQGDQSTYAENGATFPASRLPKDFYSSRFYTDKLIEYIDSGRNDGNPFFAYAAYTAPHRPLHAPENEIAAQKGRYDTGYEIIRSRRIERMKALGVVGRGLIANPGLPSETEGGHAPKRWAELSAEDKAKEARAMEVYAAMVSHLDAQVGRLIDHLKRTGQYDNTLIVFMSDNGPAGPERDVPGRAGTRIDNSLANIGRPGSSAGYGVRWAEVSATPWRMFKAFTGAEGATAVPFIAKLPQQTQRQANIDARVHVTDVLPTFLEAAGVSPPGAQYRGRRVQPLDSVSLLSALKDGKSPSASDRVFADELHGNGYVVKGKWKLSQQAPLERGPIGTAGIWRKDVPWQLFDLENDRGETRDLAAARPDVVAALRAEWAHYVKRNGVIEQARASSGE